MARRKRTEEQVTVEQAENGAVLEDEEVQTGTAEETGEQVAETVAEVTEQADAEAEGHKCRMCGRTLTADQSITRGLGPLCASHVARSLGIPVSQLSVTDPSAEGYIAEDAVEASVEKLKDSTVRYAEDAFDPTAEEQVHPNFPEQGPQKWVTIRQLTKEVTEQGLSMAAFIKAFGGDRGFGEPKDWYWKPVYAGRVRYVPALAQERLAVDIPPRRARKAAAEVDQAETPAEAEDTGEGAENVLSDQPVEAAPATA